MRKRSVALGAVLTPLIAFELVVLYAVMRNSSWVFDDNFLLVLAGQEGFTWHWLTSVQFEHWDIGWHVLISLQHRLFFLDYRWALALMLALLGGSVVLLERSLAMIVRNRWVSVGFAAWFGVSLIWARPLQWWAAGSQYFPYTLFDLLCLYGFLRFHAGCGARWIFVSAGALAAALLFYEKPAYMLVYLVLLRVLLMSEDLHPRAVLAGFWNDRWIWASYLLVIAVWGGGYAHAHAYTSSGGVRFGDYLTYFRILWFQTLAPTLAGVTIPAANLDALQLLFVVLAQFVVASCVVVSLRRRRSAWRAWAFLAIIIVLAGVLVARSRVGIFGVGVGNDPRYLIDYSWLVPLTLCCAFGREKVIAPVAPKSKARLTLPTSGRVLVLTGATLAVYAIVTLASAVHLERAWAGPQARQWDAHVRSGIASFERSGVHPVVAGNATPFEIMAEFVAPYNRLSRLLPLYVGPIQIDGPLDGPLVRLAEDGTVHAAVLTPASPVGTVSDLIAHRQFGVGPGGRVVHSGSDLCVIADGAPVAVTREVTPIPDKADAPYYVRLQYRVWRAMKLGVSVDTGGGAPAIPDYQIALSPSAHASIAWIGSTPPHSVSLIMPPLSTMCLGRFDLTSIRDRT